MEWSEDQIAPYTIIVTLREAPYSFGSETFQNLTLLLTNYQVVKSRLRIRHLTYMSVEILPFGSANIELQQRQRTTELVVRQIHWTEIREGREFFTQRLSWQKTGWDQLSFGTTKAEKSHQLSLTLTSTHLSGNCYSDAASLTQWAFWFGGVPVLCISKRCNISSATIEKPDDYVYRTKYNTYQLVCWRLCQGLLTSKGTPAQMESFLIACPKIYYMYVSNHNDGNPDLSVHGATNDEPVSSQFCNIKRCNLWSRPIWQGIGPGEQKVLMLSIGHKCHSWRPNTLTRSCTLCIDR